MSGAKKYVDDTVSDVSNGANNAGSQGLSFLSNSINNIGSQEGGAFNSIVQGGKSQADRIGSYLKNSENIAADVQKLGSRLEKTGQRATQGAAALASGKWNNALRSVMDANGVTAVATITGTPDENLSKVFGDTFLQRSAKEAVAQAEDAAKIDAQAELQNQLDGVAQTIAGITGQRAKTPGRESILLSLGKNKPSRVGTKTLLSYGA